MANKFKVSNSVKEFFQTGDVKKAINDEDLASLYYYARHSLSDEDKAAVFDILIKADINVFDWEANESPRSFMAGSQLQEIDTSGNWSSLGIGFMEHCPNLKRVVIGDNITQIGSNAFRDCPNLQIVVMGENVTAIDAGAFIQCPKLQRIYLPESVRLIKADALQANDNCYILSPPRKRGSLHIKGDVSWYKEHLGVDPRFRENAEEVSEESEA